MNIAIISFQNNTCIIGAKYIHSFLLAANHNSHLILQPHETNSDDSILKFIREQDIQLIGISFMSSEFSRATQFSKKLKETFNYITLVFGGIHATIAPEECLTLGDFAIRGEGEHTLLKLVHSIENKKSYEQIPGLCYKSEDFVQINPAPVLIQNIDTFPFPNHIPQKMFIVHKNKLCVITKKIFDSYSRYNGKFPNIITTRGCPYSCSYCCNSAYQELYGSCYNRVRRRSVESVIAECLEITLQYKGCLSLNIQDDCFLTHDKKWIDDFSVQYKLKINLPLIIRTTPKHITEEKLVALREAKLAIVIIGLQSGSDRVNKDIYKRNITSNEFITATNMVKKVGLCGYYDIILDNPFESEEDVLNTLEIILQIQKPYQFQLYSLCLYQGTEIHKRAKLNKISFNDPKHQDYRMVSKNILNKLIHIVPTTPTPLVRYLIKSKNLKSTKSVINLLYSLNKLIFIPISHLLMVYYAYKCDLLLTIKIIKAITTASFYKIIYSTKIKTS